jgi:hypothetical protein
MNIDISNFPKVNVTFPEIVEDDSLQFLLTTWKKLYDNKEYFEFHFDTRQLSGGTLTHCLMMANFMGELKKEPIKYLQKSVIITDSSIVHMLLKFVFSIQSPIAKVLILDKDHKLLSEF